MDTFIEPDFIEQENFVVKGKQRECIYFVDLCLHLLIYSVICANDISVGFSVQCALYVYCQYLGRVTYLITFILLLS